MTIKCLVVCDTTFRGQEISRFLDPNKTVIQIEDNFSSFVSTADSILFDLVIIANKHYDQAILNTEVILRLSPDSKTIYLLDPEQSFPWMFMTTMKTMVDRVVVDTNLTDLCLIISNFYHLKYHSVKRVDCDVTFLEREISVIKAIQLDLTTDEICSSLNISERTFSRNINEIGLKLGCVGRTSIAIKSFRVFGDLNY
jgi:DNA-binding CsgD family transcriptional regulator